MTFYTLKLMIAKEIALIDKSRRAAINEGVTSTLRVTCSRTDKYFPPASLLLWAPSPLSLHPLRLFSRLSLSSLVLLNSIYSWRTA